MYWQQRQNPDNWIEQIRYYTDHNNKLSENELRDAFINLAYMYTREYTNVKLLEEGITQALGAKSDRFIEIATTQSKTAREIADIDLNDGDVRDILSITLNMLDYIENSEL